MQTKAGNRRTVGNNALKKCTLQEIVKKGNKLITLSGSKFWASDVKASTNTVCCCQKA